MEAPNRHIQEGQAQFTTGLQSLQIFFSDLGIAGYSKQKERSIKFILNLSNCFVKKIYIFKLCSLLCTAWWHPIISSAAVLQLK